MDKNETLLESAPNGALVRRFSIPCVISMVVAALYNIVDQIFIGWSEAGANGNAATNIVYPVTVFALGGQPIIGYNMVAGNVARVKSCIGVVTKAVLTVGAVAFLLFELCPSAMIALFGTDNSPEYIEFARLCIRIFLSGIILTCYIKAGSIILQSMGSSVKSTITALMRDVIVFVPAFFLIRSEIKKREKL